MQQNYNTTIAPNYKKHAVVKMTLIFISEEKAMRKVYLSMVAVLVRHMSSISTWEVRPEIICAHPATQQPLPSHTRCFRLEFLCHRIWCFSCTLHPAGTSKDSDKCDSFLFRFYNARLWEFFKNVLKSLREIRDCVSKTILQKNCL